MESIYVHFLSFLTFFSSDEENNIWEKPSLRFGKI